MTLETSVSAYLLRRKRSLEEAARDVARSREQHKGLTVISLEDERKLREVERVMAGEK